MASRQLLIRAGGIAPPASAVPEIAVRLVGALLALAVSAVHIADQGGMAVFASPDWMGWGYRLIEAGGVVTAVALLLGPLAPPAARSARPSWALLARQLGWAAGALLGAGPFLGYVVSRTIGMPGDARDVGNWGHWVGTVSLLVEAALVALSVSMLLALRQSGREQAASSRRSAMRTLPVRRADPAAGRTAARMTQARPRSTRVTRAA
jgi:hypothetical protein